VMTGPLSFNAIKTEIDQQRPICVRVQWKDGGGHFAAIVGYDIAATGLQRVFIADAFYGDSSHSYDLFVSKYQGEGVWTHTYLVQE